MSEGGQQGKATTSNMPTLGSRLGWTQDRVGRRKPYHITAWFLGLPRVYIHLSACLFLLSFRLNIQNLYF